MSKLLLETLIFVQPGFLLAVTVFIGLMTVTVLISWVFEEKKKKGATSIVYVNEGEKAKKSEPNFGFVGDVEEKKSEANFGSVGEGEDKSEEIFGYMSEGEEKRIDDGHMDVWFTGVDGIAGDVVVDTAIPLAGSEIINVIKVVGVAVVGAVAAAGAAVAVAALAVVTAIMVVGVAVMGVAAVAMAVAVEVLAVMVVEDVLVFVDK
ncbi:hypothetical protein SUGI_1127260 [Cryptomeria japonica]|nr:hypothetical protein SUGI_1127260 [Cryptomeria japonica]